ncbi:hypothetical protein HNP38_000148 [Chryseobacterium defluvii]|uniref:Uncharacterized protein n=1 Tax=Chryseobacterium defluvii TaxID=160396 RepID=A0A840K6M5_9FLAO|nr:hypothetical protein [Chryseobacterium defluvii]MBB4804876.1 hypothetical protein [Chryseobacterium defluvii]
MKNIIILIFSIAYTGFFAQNIKCESVDYLKKTDNKEYSTYQYINASYSYSRPLLIVIADEKVFTKIHLKVPNLFSTKQEYTDINLLGIKNFDKDHISDIDSKIIDDFVENIIKYRSVNNLPPYTKEQLKSQLKFIQKDNDICRFLVCKK